MVSAPKDLSSVLAKLREHCAVSPKPVPAKPSAPSPASTRQPLAPVGCTAFATGARPSSGTAPTGRPAARPNMTPHLTAVMEIWSDSDGPDDVPDPPGVTLP